MHTHAPRTSTHVLQTTTCMQMHVDDVGLGWIMDYYADRRRRPLNNCNSGANGYLTCQCQCGTLLSIFTTTTERATHYATTLIVTQLVELTYASQSDFPADVHSPCRGKICNHQGEGVPRVGIEIAGSICICRRTKVCAG
jgi:hypothetical protein